MKSILMKWGTVFLLIGCTVACRQPVPGGHGNRPPSDVVNRNEPINRHEVRLVYTKHARCRMDCRHITEKEIREILEQGDINYRKSEPNSRPDPKYALDGHTVEGQSLRVVFASSDRGLVVITCIDLDNEWQCDCN
jgi:hypothetical protein